MAVVCAVLLAALPAGVAGALPGDPAFGPLAPADGATTSVDANGILVSFTCPVYRVADTGFPVYGGAKDYGVGLSPTPTLGSDGRLADATRNTGAYDASVGTDGCSAYLGAGGAAPRIQETPGTYYWQVWRICTGCVGSYEVGPVQTLVLRSPVRATVRAPRTAYAGYPFFVSLSAPGAPDGTATTIERRIGTTWKAIATTPARGGGAEAAVSLPRGSQRLRAVVTLGGQRIESAPATVSVARAARWTTRRSDDGAYRGTIGARSVRFTVGGGGRLITGFTAYVPMLCPGIEAGQFTTQIGTAIVRRVRIGPDGRFVATATSGQDTAIRVRGRLQRGRVGGGRAELSVGTCSGSAAFTARRG